MQGPSKPYPSTLRTTVVCSIVINYSWLLHSVPGYDVTRFRSLCGGYVRARGILMKLAPLCFTVQYTLVNAFARTECYDYTLKGR